MANQDLSPIIKESFSQYSGAVLQSRALVDARDCMKPSARQIFYCMETDKFVAKKPFQKTLKAIGSAMRMYIHGDSSCEGIIMRAGQPFAMRYPLVEVEGSYGNLMESGNWAAPRYTASRLSPIAAYLFRDINKNAVEEWRDNYDDTEKYPAVLPTKGFYNLCNGTMGIGVGAASSIPQFNLKELNVALIRLLVNPNTPFEDLYCAPDFATGGVLLNNSEVKESLRKGTGAACKLRSVINYDAKDNCLVVTEIPYSVYTNTICGQLEEILQGENNPGIDRFNDLTGEKPLIKIYLNKGVNPPKVIDYLFKNTSLQYFYKINFTMLDGGRYPKVFTFKEALQAHLDHEREVYIRSFKFDLEKIQKRLNIITGLLIAIADIDNVIKIIKGCKNKDNARTELLNKYNFNLEQVDAILEMKLVRLTNLETVDLTSEKGELLKEQERINAILTDTKLLNDEIEKGLREVMLKFGDERRTRVADEINPTCCTDQVQIEPTKYLYAVIDNNSILPLPITEKVNLAKKGSPFAKNKISMAYFGENLEQTYLFDKKGYVYKINNIELQENMLNPVIFNNEPVAAINGFTKEYFITVTKNGTVKKSLISEYAKLKSGTVLKLREDDELLWCGCAANDDYLFILGEKGGLVKIPISSFNATGKLTIGVKGIDDKATFAAIGNNDSLLFSVADGKGKFTKGIDYIVTSRGAKGQIITPNTTNFTGVTSDIAVIEKDSKVAFYTTKSFATKSKTASGAKITTESEIKIASL